MTPKKILAPIATGSGAYILHKSIESVFSNYEVRDYSPLAASLPIYGTRNVNNYDLLHSIAGLGGLDIYGKIPTISTFHNFYTDKAFCSSQNLTRKIYYSTLLTWYVNYSTKRSTKITTVSKFLWKLVKNELGIDSELIPNGVDTNQFKSTHSDRSSRKVFKVLFAGNPTSRKGIETIKTLVQSLPKGIEVSLTNGARDLNYSLNSENIKMIGKVPHSDMNKVYNQHDLLLLPTLREGLSLVILEAMACGLPILTTNIPSNQELIKHEKGGYLYPLGNDKELFSLLIKLSKNPDLSHEMGLYNREVVTNQFNSKKMHKSYSDLFSQTLQQS